MISAHSRVPDSTPWKVWTFHNAFWIPVLGRDGELPPRFHIIERREMCWMESAGLFFSSSPSGREARAASFWALRAVAASSGRKPRVLAQAQFCRKQLYP